MVGEGGGEGERAGVGEKKGGTSCCCIVMDRYGGEDFIRMKIGRVYESDRARARMWLTEKLHHEYHEIYMPHVHQFPLFLYLINYTSTF